MRPNPTGRRGSRPTVEHTLITTYRCRDDEGGCGAGIGEHCKTHATGKPTACHQDRWLQWELDGSPGAWWHHPTERKDDMTDTRETPAELRPVIVAALEIAAAAPMRRGENVTHALIPWHMVTDLRAALDEVGMDWESLRATWSELREQQIAEGRR